MFRQLHQNIVACAKWRVFVRCTKRGAYAKGTTCDQGQAEAPGPRSKHGLIGYEQVQYCSYAHVIVQGPITLVHYRSFVHISILSHRHESTAY